MTRVRFPAHGRGPGDLGAPDVPLRRRVRAGGHIVLFSIVCVAAMDLALRRVDVGTLTILKLLQGGGILLALALLRRTATDAGVGWIGGAAAAWAIAGAALTGVVRHDVQLGAYLGAATCLGAAAFVPWGVRVQLMVVVATTASLAAAWWLAGRGEWLALLGALPTAPASLFVAAELAGYRAREARDGALLTEAEEHVRQFVERIGEVLWVSDPASRLLYVSRAYETIWGRSRTELLHDPTVWAAALHPADRENARTLPPDTVEEGRQREYRIVRPDGTMRWIVDNAFPIRDGQGGIYARAALARDVTAIHDAAESEALRHLASRIEAAREEERRQVAREIHELLAQVLTGLKLQLASFSAHRGDVPIERLHAAAAAVDAAIAAVRRIAISLRPGILDDLGLAEALRAHARQFTARTGIPCELELPARDPLCGAEQTTALFRIADEALDNVARHAQARRVRVRLEARNADITLQIDDDGMGFAAGDLQATHALGLLAMRERARAVGGQVEVVGRPGEGTSVLARLRTATPQSAAEQGSPPSAKRTGAPPAAPRSADSGGEPC